MKNKQNRGIQRLVLAFRYSCAGLRCAISKESSFRQELALLFILVPVALWLGQSPVEYALLIGSLLLILLTELLNSGLENIVDLATKDFHPLAQRAKDLGSAAVLVAIFHACLIWGFIALPSLLERL